MHVNMLALGHVEELSDEMLSLSTLLCRASHLQVSKHYSNMHTTLVNLNNSMFIFPSFFLALRDIKRIKTTLDMIRFLTVIMFED